MTLVLLLSLVVGHSLHELDNMSKLLTFLASSRSANPNVEVRNQGASFDITLDRPIIIPEHAKDIYLEVKNATIWWSVPNIVEGVNNILTIKFDRGGGAFLETFTLEIPTGLYDVTNLSNKIAQLINDLNVDGALMPQIPLDLLKLLSDSAENKIVIEFNYPDTQLDFTVGKSINVILGFNERLVPAGGVTLIVPDFETGDVIAAFNTIDYFLISCPSLANYGLNFNSVYNSLIARVLIDVAPNSQINYDPRQTYLINVDSIAGNVFHALTFNLLDDKGNLVNTRGEEWSVLFTIRYNLY